MSVSITEIKYASNEDVSVVLSNGETLGNLTKIQTDQGLCGLQKFKIEGFILPTEPPQSITKEQTQTRIDEIMDWFDFGKVSKVMEALEWFWVDSHEVEIPDEPMLREAARGLLWKAYSYGRYSDTCYTVGTGGFYATYDPLGDWFRLTFEVARWENTE